MAPAVHTIDDAKIQSLIDERLRSSLSSSEVTYVPLHEDPPEDEDVWAQLVAVDIDRTPRHRCDGQVDLARVVVTVNVTVSGAQVGAHAWRGAAQAVALALDEWTTDDQVSSGHLITFDRAGTFADPAFAERGARTGHVQAAGTAQRSSGLLTTTDYID